MTNLTDRIASALHELVEQNGGVSRGAADMRNDATAIAEVVSGSVVWRPIADIKHALKGSGASILLWSENDPIIGFWQDSGPNAGQWLDEDDAIIHPTHFARIDAPEK